MKILNKNHITLFVLQFIFFQLYSQDQILYKTKTKKNTFSYFETKVGLHSWLRPNETPSIPFPITTLGFNFKKGKSEYSIISEVDYSRFSKKRATFSYLNLNFNYGFYIFSRNKFQLSLNAGFIISKMVYGKFNQKIVDRNTQEEYTMKYSSRDGELDYPLDGISIPRINIFANLDYKLSDKLIAKFHLGTNFSTYGGYECSNFYPSEDCNFSGSSIRTLAGLSYKVSKDKPETRLVTKKFKPWSFYSTLKLGKILFQKRPSFSLGVRFQKNRHNLGLNSYIEVMPTFIDRFGTKKYTFINVDAYYSFSIFRIKSFTTSLGIGVLNGKTINASWIRLDGTQKNMSNNWRSLAFTSFLEFWVNISPKFAISNSYTFLSGYSDVSYRYGGAIENPCFECGRESDSFRIYLSLHYRFFKQKLKESNQIK